MSGRGGSVIEMPYQQVSSTVTAVVYCDQVRFIILPVVILPHRLPLRCVNDLSWILS